MPQRRLRHGALLLASAALVGTTWMSAGPAGAQAVAPTATPTIYTAAGSGLLGFGGDGGPANKAKLDTPTGVAEDLAGNLYIADSGNNRVRRVGSSSTGTITTFAGTGSFGFSGDGGPAGAAKLAAPTGVAADAFGDLFIADAGNNRIREVLPNGTIKTYAGTGACSLRGDGGPATAAGLCFPTAVALDNTGDLFIADTGNNLIRKITPVGVISIFAGKPGFSGIGRGGDGGKATKAQLGFPTGVAVDNVQRLVYIADTGIDKVRVVNAAGTINSFAGGGRFGFGGDGGPAAGAKLAGPSGLGVDPSGNVYIADTGNSRIRVVNLAHTISTYAGTGIEGYSGDKGPAGAAKLDFPTGGLATDGQRVFFSDTGNSRVRAITTGPPPVIPETRDILLLPLSALALVAGGLVLQRRRRRSLSPT